MNKEEIMSLDSEYIMGTYGRYSVVPDHGKNDTLFDVNGKKYIDFTAGIGVNSLGYSDEGWISAVTEQLCKFQHISNYYYSSVNASLAEKLCNLSGMKKIFFANSGAEANEGTIKIARKYSFDKYGEGRKTVITLRNSFHGRTITTLAATGQDSFHTIFTPMTEGFKYVAANDINDMKQAMTDDVCAVLLEPIQGEGGVNIINEEYIKKVRALCDKRDILLIFDEVQTGVGRTGEIFAYKYFDFEPDLVTAAKGLGGGLPIGAVLAGEKCCDVLCAGQHGTTFGANPAVAAGAMYVLKRLTENGFLDEVKVKGEYICHKIAEMKLPHVINIRGKGLMIGIQIDSNPKVYSKKCADEGLLILTAGTDVIRFLPPLTITYAAIDEGLAIFEKVLRSDTI